MPFVAVAGNIALHFKLSKGWTEIQEEKRSEKKRVYNQVRTNQTTRMTRESGEGCASTRSAVEGGRATGEDQGREEAETADNQTSERDTLDME